MENLHDEVEEQHEPTEDDLIRERIKLAILSKKIKLKAFARESGMAYPSLRDYYSGLRKPGFDAIATILRFTGVSAEWLVLGQGNIFNDEETHLANVDEVLIAQITKAIEEEDCLDSKKANSIEVAEAPEGDYLYAAPQRREKLHQAGSRGVIIGSVYNRVANITPALRQEETIKREVRSLMRMHRSLSQVDANAET